MRARWLIVPAVALGLVLGGGFLAGPGTRTDPGGSGTSATSQPPVVRLPDLPAVPTKQGPLYGMVYPSNGEHAGDLVRLDPRTLRPVKGIPRLRMESGDSADAMGTAEYVMAISPDRSVVVTGNDGDTLTVVELRTMRRLGTLRANQAVGRSLAGQWLDPDRLLLAGHREKGAYVRYIRSSGPQYEQRGSLVATLLDLRAMRVVSQRAHTIPAGQWPTEAEPAAGGVVVKLRPEDGIGTAGLAYVGADGGVGWARLDRIRAGSSLLEEQSTTNNTPTSRQVEPGLAVDQAGNRAFVVSAGSPVAEVSLPSLRVTYHDLAEPGRPRSPLAWLGEVFAPSAEAKLVSGPVRQAVWLGNGFLAVWGEDYSIVENDDGSPGFRTRAYGVRLIDTRTWTIRTLVPAASQAAPAGNRLVAFGGSSDPGDDGRPIITNPAGLQVLAPAARQPIRAFQGRQLTWVETYGTYAYVNLDRPETDALETRFAVMDLRTGEIIGTQEGREIPLLLD